MPIRFQLIVIAEELVDDDDSLDERTFGSLTATVE
jgi:hypothetical protein